MKRAKRTIIKHKVIQEKSYITEYQCPHCHIIMVGDSVRKNVTRFLCCSCKEEIIVDSIKEVINE